MFHTNGIKPVGVKKFYWYPTDKQWWITGFNPEYLREEVDVHKQAMICRIDLSKNEKIYKALEETADPKNKDEDYYNSAANDYLLFNDDEHIVWIFWYKRR